MKKLFVRIVVAAVVIAVGGLVWTFLPVRLKVPEAPGVPMLAPSRPPAELRIRLLESGSISGLHAFSVRGGSLRPYNSAMIAVLIEHPRGTYLLDAGFGRNVEQHFKTASRLMQAFARVTLKTPTADQLRSLGIATSDLDGVLLTHAHWDHTSGLEDLPGVAVYLPRQELDEISLEDPNTRLTAEWRDTLDFHILELGDGPYYGFEKSHDLFGDGSVVLVEMGGHTPGSVGVFVHLSGGRRYLFAGDVSWTREGYAWPAEKPWLLRRQVDRDPETVRRRLVQVHRLMLQDPSLVVVPAHDPRVHRRVREELSAL